MIPFTNADQAAAGQESQTGRTIWIGFGVLLTMFVLLLLLSMGELRKMDQRVAYILEDGLEHTALVQEMHMAARQRSMLLVELLNEPDPFLRDEQLLQYEALAGRFAAARLKLIKHGLDAAEQELLARQAVAVAKIRDAQIEVVEAALRDDMVHARLMLLRTAVPAQEVMLGILSELSDYVNSRSREESAEARRAYVRTSKLVWLGGSLTVLCGIGVAWGVKRRLLGLIREREGLTQSLQETLRDLNFQKQAMDEHAIVSITDAAGNITYANDKFLQISGYTYEDLIGRNHRLLKSGMQPQALFDDMWATISAGQVWHGEVCNRARDGSHYWVNTSIVPFLDHDGLPARYVSVRTDITQTKANEAALLKIMQELEQRVAERTTELREQLHFVTELMEALPNPVYYKDVRGHYLGVNQAWERMFGVARDKIVGKTMQQLCSRAPEIEAEHAAMDASLCRDGGTQSYEINVPAADGQSCETVYYKAVLTNNQGGVTGLVGVIVDVTERKRGEVELKQRYAEVQALNTQLQDMQHQLLQSEKMASVGQLAAGVAHEINNPIGYVFSNLGTLEKYVQDVYGVVDAYAEIESAIGDAALLARLRDAREKADLQFLREDTRALMDETREGITRVKKIVQDLKDFSRIDASDEWHWADLQKCLDSTLNIVRNELKYKAEVRKEYADIPEVECRASQLNQVFLNLLVNAGHAIEEKGTITLRTGQEGEQVWVEIADSGKGIAPENLTRIFDPFFTTKPIGQGTGLGLSLSYGIVQQHGGHITVESVVGQGTVFRVWLPIRQNAPQEAETV